MATLISARAREDQSSRWRSALAHLGPPALHGPPLLLAQRKDNRLDGL